MLNVFPKRDRTLSTNISIFDKKIASIAYNYIYESAKYAIANLIGNFPYITLAKSQPVPKEVVPKEEIFEGVTNYELFDTLKEYANDTMNRI